jgi:hypothetical protein
MRKCLINEQANENGFRNPTMYKFYLQFHNVNFTPHFNKDRVSQVMQAVLSPRFFRIWYYILVQRHGSKLPSRFARSPYCKWKSKLEII